MSSQIGVWKATKLNRSSRPVLEEDEVILYIKDHVGLYQGKSKIIGRQDGRIYLTKKRIIYADEANADNSLSLSWDRVHHIELVERFLRSSPKVKLFLKEETKDENLDLERKISSVQADWVCTICSFNNHIGLQEGINKEVKCISCGVRATPSHLRAAIDSKRQELIDSQKKQENSFSSDLIFGQCPKCTFINHPSLHFCEMCGSNIKTHALESHSNTSDFVAQDHSFTASPKIILENGEEYTNSHPYVKLSFRKGGEDKFFTLAGEILSEIKWENLKKRGGINENGTKLNDRLLAEEVSKKGGIHRLEQISEDQRKANAFVLTNSLEDFEQLMYRSQDLIKLATNFGPLVKAGNTDRLIAPFNIPRSSNLFHEELARHISEFLTNCILAKHSSMVTFQELFAQYNSYLLVSQGLGTPLISPQDLNRVVPFFDSLNLPVTLRHYEKSGLTVVQCRTATEFGDYIIQSLTKLELNALRQELRSEIIYGNNFTEKAQIPNSLKKFYKGSTASELQESLGWSYNIILEELELCISSGHVVVDHDISSTFYYINRFSSDILNEDFILSESSQIRQDLENEQKDIQKKFISRQQNISHRYESNPGSESTPNYSLNDTYGLMIDQLTLSDLSLSTFGSNANCDKPDNNSKSLVDIVDLARPTSPTYSTNLQPSLPNSLPPSAQSDHPLQNHQDFSPALDDLKDLKFSM